MDQNINNMGINIRKASPKCVPGGSVNLASHSSDTSVSPKKYTYRSSSKNSLFVKNLRIPAPITTSSISENNRYEKFNESSNKKESRQIFSKKMKRYLLYAGLFTFRLKMRFLLFFICISLFVLAFKRNSLVWVHDPSFIYGSIFSQKKKSQLSQMHPRLHYLVFQNHIGAQENFKYRSNRVRIIEQFPAEHTDSTQLYPVLTSEDETVLSNMERKTFPDGMIEKPGDCSPMSEWQTIFFPRCNIFHEIDIKKKLLFADRSLTLVGKKGYWRQAWKVEDSWDVKRSKRYDRNGENPVIMKTLR